ncbi:MAG TPA: GDSL-type esterase/lipase family protein [Draconibacterium sp.]|nr:GDSL-type esterase/lipase family protein [Draconibacterium sp.]
MKCFRFCFLLIIFVSGSIVSNSQKLDSKSYHTIRTNLVNSVNKFQKEKSGRVAFLGGSITHNTGWRDSFCNFIQKEYPETKFDFINAGVPSMGSTPGAFRFENDVLKNGKVDLLFLEAAVNDDTNSTPPEEIIRGMEGIVRHAKMANPLCDIVIMHFVDPGKMVDYRAGKIPGVIQLHEKVAEHYKISTINLAKEVTERIDAGEFDWENDFKDLHPSPFGQRVYAQSMMKFLQNALKSDESVQPTALPLPDPLDKHSYSNGILIEPNPPKKIKGWEMVENWNPADGKGTRDNYINVPMLVGNYPGKIVKFLFKGNAVGIAVAAGPDAGIIEYSIDESDWKKQDLFTQWSTDLYLPWFYTLGSGLKSGKHTLQIRLTDEKNPESKGNKCVLRYFYFNGTN